MVLTVHHLNDSRSQRVLWLLEEMGLDYQIKHYQRGADKRAPKELRDVHPLGKSPVLTDEITAEDGSKKTKTIPESGAIVDYLIRHYGNGRFVARTPELVDQDVFWSHFSEGSLMPTLVMKLVFGIIPTQAPFLVRPLVNAICSGVQSKFVEPEVNSKMSFVGDEVAKVQSGWLAGGDKDGNPTAADFQMAFPLEAALAGRVENINPSIKEYVDKIHSRPAYKKALEKGGPYSYGPSSK